MNSLGTLEASGHSRVHVGNIYNPAPERLKTPPSPSFNIPFRRDNDFVKRENILNQLSQILSGPASRAALAGLGGVGKSQLAIEHAYRMRDRFKQTNTAFWAFWVHATTRTRVEEDFKRIADIAEIPSRNEPTANIFQVVYRWLQDERTCQWLMVLDSADDLSVFYDADDKGKQPASVAGGGKQLWEYLPQSSNGSILITTRSKELASRLTGSHRNVIEVGPMDEEHALELLAAKSGSQYDREDGRKLVNALECVPLAISQAAAYIQERQPRMSVQRYLNKFQKNEQSQSSLLNHDSGDLRRDGSASNSVITTWQISFDYIRTIRPSATNLLSLMSFFDCQGIFDYLVRPIKDLSEKDNDEACSDNDSTATSKTWDPEFEEDVRMLGNYCLIKTNEAGDIFEIHGLVQLSTKEWLEQHGDTERFKEQYIRRMFDIFPSGIFENWGIFRQLLPHAERAIQYRPINQELLIEWANILYGTGWFLKEQGIFSSAEQFMTLAMSVCKTALGLEHQYTLKVMHELAVLYSAVAQFEEAEELQLQVVEISKRVLGTENLETLSSMHCLAMTYYEQQRLEEAEQLNIQVLEIRKRILGVENRWTLTSMNNLALVYTDQGRLGEAEKIHLQVIGIRKRLLGPRHQNTLTSMHNLALMYGDQWRLGEAEEIYLQVLETRKRVLGAAHPDTLKTMYSLAWIWKHEDRVREALRLFEDCYQSQVRVFGSEHPDTQHTLLWLQECRDGASEALEGSEHSENQAPSSDTQLKRAETSDGRRKRSLTDVYFSIRTRIRKSI
ncbi:P-loop containing nucleoside triphosphate hydrolase protein [Xylaria arbuscula]|nr:P-loop containing nucleoside triphosphate hydrolase protein [Xylaria arbuscula]